MRTYQLWYEYILLFYDTETIKTVFWQFKNISNIIGYLLNTIMLLN